MSDPASHTQPPKTKRSVKAILQELLGTTLDDAGDANVSTTCFCSGHKGVADQSNSLSIRTDNGLWFCHTTGKGGNLLDVVIAKKGLTKGDAFKWLQGEGIDLASKSGPGGGKTHSEEDDRKAPDVPEPILKVYQTNLANTPSVVDNAGVRMGWSAWVIQHFGIGYDLGTSRYAIPVRDADGNLKNIRLYNPDSSGDDKTISFSDRSQKKDKLKFGKMRLWPNERPTKQRVLFVEGEKDAIKLTEQIELNAVPDTEAMTGTGGAGSWRDYWNERFEDRDVVILYDCDKAGREAAEARATALMRHARTVRVVDLKLENEGGDVTDFFHFHGKATGRTWDDLEALINEAEVIDRRTTRAKPVREKDPNTYNPHLSEASGEQFLYKNQELRVIVAGKDLSPFAVPRRVTLSCDQNNGKACNSCVLNNNRGVMNHQYEADDPDLIKFVNITDKDAHRQIKEDSGVVKSCPRVEFDVESHQNLEEVTLIPEIDFAEEDREYVSRTAYLTTHGIQPNKVYVMRGTTLPHPKTQHVVHFINEVEPAQDSIDDFNMTPELLESLKVFQTQPGQTVGEKFDEIANDLTYNVTEIWGRQDLIKGMDLCYHTVLAFDFQEKAVAKAWGDILIIGDTRTGKSETLIAISRHYHAGEMVDGENATLAGLVGGVRQEAGKRWSVRWGRLPLNDRRLLILEEASGIELETIGKMSGIRSNGIADLAKIEGQKTMARTRLIINSNPRSSRSMSSYAHGVDAVKELMGRPEDIARFDIVLTAATSEVPFHEVNKAKSDRTPIPHVYTSDLCHKLVLWAWSRKSEHVQFTPEATQKCLDYAIKHSETYAATGVHLVEGGNQRIKIAKLAVAAAARTFSTSDGENLLVTEDHVDFVAAFIDEIYSKPSLDYAGYSEVVLARENVPEDKKNIVRDWIRAHGDWAQLWLHHNTARVDDFRTQFDLSQEDVKSHIFKPLSVLNMIERANGSSYIKTPVFIALIKEIREAEGLNTSSLPGSTGSVPNTSSTGGSTSQPVPSAGTFGPQTPVTTTDDDIPF